MDLLPSYRCTELQGRNRAQAPAPLGSLVGGALATGIGLRQTLWVIGVLGLTLAVVAMRWSPVRRHRHLPAVAIE